MWLLLFLCRRGESKKAWRNENLAEISATRVYIAHVADVEALTDRGISMRCGLVKSQARAGVVS